MLRRGEPMTSPLQATPAKPSPATPSDQRVPLWGKIGFGAGDFGFNLVWTGTNLFLMYFYTDVLGLAPTTAGLIYLIAMVWDGVTDPAMGIIADRTRSRWGRYRPYLLFGAVPLALCYPLAYFDPGLEGIALLAWTLFTHCLLRTAYTALSIPFSSLQARLTTDADERASLAGWRMVGAASGGLTIAILTPQIVLALGTDDEARGYFTAAALAGVALWGLVWFSFFTMREPVSGDEDTPPSANTAFADLIAFFRSLPHNTPLLRVLTVVMVSSIALQMFSKNILYFFKYDVGSMELLTVAVALPAFVLILGVPLWVVVARATSKRTAWLCGGALASTGYLAFFFNPSKDPLVIFPIMALIALGGAAFAVTFWSMLPDTVEYGEAETGQRHEAKAFGFANFAMKASLGINAALLGVLLDATGFVANETQTEDALFGIRAIMTLIPLAGVIICAIVLWRYPIDAAYHAALKERIAARRAQRP